MDADILIWINQSWGHPWLDNLFSWLSGKIIFSFPLLGILICYLGIRFGIDGWKAGCFLLGLIIVSDGSGNLLKHILGQARPCLDYAPQLRGLADNAFLACSESSTGMPSNHALNFFVAWSFLATLIPRKSFQIGLLIIAISVALSRVYLGAHFPSQVLAGASLGIFIGYTVANIGIRRTHFLHALHKTGAR